MGFIPHVYDRGNPDPFEYLEIKYEGQNGSGYASFTVKEGAPEGVNTLSWDYTPVSDLKNGDTIEVTVSYWSESEEDTNNDLARNYAIRLTKFKQTYTVEGLEKSDEEKAAEESEESEESSESEESQESEESAESEESSESEESQDPAAAADIIGTYKLDSSLTVGSAPLEIVYKEVEGTCSVTYRLSDYYGNYYWLPAWIA